MLSWCDHVSASLAGACAEKFLLGYRGAGADRDSASATGPILAQLDEGDRAFGPSRTTIEGATRAEGNAGSEAMRGDRWASGEVTFQ